MREAPLDFEGRRDNLAERMKDSCLIHQFRSGDLSHLAHRRAAPRDHTLERLEKNDRARLVHLHVAGEVSVYEDEGDARIGGPAVLLSALIAEPGLPALFI